MSNVSPVIPDDLYQLTLVGDAQVAPDRRAVAYVHRRLDRETNDYCSHIFLWQDGESRQYTAGPKDSAPRWSPDGRFLAFLSAREGKPQLYLLPTTGGEPRRLTDEPLGAGTPVWSPDSRAIAYSGPISLFPEEEGEEKPAPTRVIDRAAFKLDGVGPIDRRRLHLTVVEVESEESRRLTDGDWDDASPCWSPDGRHLAFAADRDPEWDLRAGSDIWIVPREGGEPRRLTDGRGVWSAPTFSPEGNQVAFVGYARPEGETPTYYPQLWIAPRGGGEPVNVLAGSDLAVGDTLAGDWSAAGSGGPLWRKDGLYFLASDRGATEVYRWTGELQRVTAGRHHIMDLSLGGGRLAVTVSDATHPAEVYAAETAGDLPLHLERLTCHNDGYLAEREIVAPHYLPFAGAEGEEIDAWLMRPAAYIEGRRYPAIVYMHGGPHSAYGETFFHEFQALTGAGFGVFYCNPHGSTSHGRRFQTSIIGDWGNLDYIDMMAGTDLVAGLPWVDAHRLGVAGGSYAGFLTNWIVSHTDRFAAACTERSICNHLSQGGTSDWAATRGERLGGTPEGNWERLWDRSPLKYASQVTTPTLIVHSERDDRCPIEQGEQWFLALKRLRVPTRFIRFPEESHGLSRGGKPSRRVERLEHIIGWFKTYL